MIEHLCSNINSEQSGLLHSESGSPRDFDLEGQPRYGSRRSAFLLSSLTFDAGSADVGRELWRRRRLR